SSENRPFFISSLVVEGEPISSFDWSEKCRAGQDNAFFIRDNAVGASVYTPFSTPLEITCGSNSYAFEISKYESRSKHPNSSLKILSWESGGAQRYGFELMIKKSPCSIQMQRHIFILGGSKN
ncbi:hypothetical protein, partial [Desulfomicrobium macestii]|uniref:hypothetical protein n=1 Tax=Desulfomicrobium macestii TaxID=90731 RepID=UPI001CEF3D8D